MSKKLIVEPNEIKAVLFGYLIKQYNKVQSAKMNKYLEILNLDKTNPKGLKEFAQLVQEHDNLSKLVDASIEGEVGLEELVKYGSEDVQPLKGVDPLEVITPHVTEHYRNLRNNRAFNKQRREGAYYNILIEDLKTHLERDLGDLGTNILPTREKGFTTKLKGSSAIVTISDTHIGAVVNNHPHIGPGYNYEILLERLGDLLDEVQQVVELYDVDNIRCYFVGDAIENADMRNDQSFNSEFDTSEQISKAIRVLADFIGKLEQLRPVKFGLVNGNHDRLTGVRNKKDKIYNDSAGYLILDMMFFLQQQGLLQNTELIDNREATHIFFDKVNDKRVVVTHGDYLKRGDKFKQIQEEGLDLGFSGHLHHTAINQEDKSKMWIQTGSVMGSNAYASENNFTRATPSQTIVILNEELKGPIIYTVLL